MKAMIFAAGLGTRLRPLTNDRPKALVEIHGKTLLERRILHLKEHGFKDIIINIHHFADRVIDFLDYHKNFGVNIQVSDERDVLLETGGGLKKAANYFSNEHFLVCNADIITDLDLLDFYNYHKKQKTVATLAVRNRKTSRKLIFDDTQRLLGWINLDTNLVKWKRVFSGQVDFYAFSGLQMLHTDFFKYMMDFEGKFSIIEVYLAAANQTRIIAYPNNNSLWLDVGKPETLVQAEQLLKEHEV